MIVPGTYGSQIPASSIDSHGRATVCGLDDWSEGVVTQRTVAIANRHANFAHKCPQWNLRPPIEARALYTRTFLGHPLTA